MWMGDVPVMKRVFAHTSRSKKGSNGSIVNRSDFTNTVYWNTALATDEHGKATVNFELSDSITSYRVLADAYAVGGLIVGESNTVLIPSKIPFHVDASLPLFAVSGDKIKAPLAVVAEDASSKEQIDVKVESSVMGPLILSDREGSSWSQRERAHRSFLNIDIGEGLGKANVTAVAKASNGMSDSITRATTVRSNGFPMKINTGSLLNPTENFAWEFSLPAQTVPKSLKASVTVYPSPLANLAKSLEALIQEPYGCFEQTSSTTYPLVMAAQYFHYFEKPSRILIRMRKFI